MVCDAGGGTVVRAYYEISAVKQLIFDQGCYDLPRYGDQSLALEGSREGERYSLPDLLQ